MRKLLLTLAALVGMGLALIAHRASRAMCRRHDVERYLGGWRCKLCPAVFADLGEAGLMDSGYLDKRTQYGREPGQGVTRDWFLQ